MHVRAVPGPRARPHRLPSTSRTTATRPGRTPASTPHEPPPPPHAGPASHLRTRVHSTAGAGEGSGDPRVFQDAEPCGAFLRRDRPLGPSRARPQICMRRPARWIRVPVPVPPPPPSRLVQPQTSPGGAPSSPSPPRNPEVTARGEPAVVPRSSQNKSPSPGEAPFALAGPCAPPASLPVQAPSLRCGAGSSAFGAQGVGNLILLPSPAA